MKFWLLSHHNPLVLLVLLFPTVFGVNHYGPKLSKEKRMCDAGGFPTAEMLAAMSAPTSHSPISGAKFDTIFGRNIVTVIMNVSYQALRKQAILRAVIEICILNLYSNTENYGEAFLLTLWKHVSLGNSSHSFFFPQLVESDDINPWKIVCPQNLEPDLPVSLDMFLCFLPGICCALGTFRGDCDFFFSRDHTEKRLSLR